MRRLFLYIGLTLVLSVAFISCKPNEERVVDRLNRLSERVQKDGAKWDQDQWADALEELEEIHEDMEDCEFTPAQLRALGRVEGRLTVVIMTEGAKKLGKELIPFMEGAGAFMKGYQEGAESMQGYSEEELKQLGTNLNQEMERIQKDLDME